MEKFEGKPSTQEIIKQYENQLRVFNEKLESFDSPLGHGTTSEHLKSILETGLGGVVPENSYAQSISLTDLEKPDGLLGAYAFARMNTQDLEFIGEDVVTRYSELNSLVDVVSLKAQFQKYKDLRNPTGFPVVCVFEGKDVKFEYMNPRIPSEVELKLGESPLKPKILLVPNKKVNEIKKIAEDSGVTCEVLPIEILEV
jgi:hypothetical protein